MYIYPDRFTRYVVWGFGILLVGILVLLLFSLLRESWSLASLVFSLVVISGFLKLLVTFLFMRIDLKQKDGFKFVNLWMFFHKQVEMGVSDITEWGVRRARTTGPGMRGYQMYRFKLKNGKIIDYFAPYSVSYREVFNEATKRITEFIGSQPKDYGYMRSGYDGILIALFI